MSVGSARSIWRSDTFRGASSSLWPQLNKCLRCLTDSKQDPSEVFARTHSPNTKVHLLLSETRRTPKTATLTIVLEDRHLCRSLRTSALRLSRHTRPARAFLRPRTHRLCRNRHSECHLQQGNKANPDSLKVQPFCFALPPRQPHLTVNLTATFCSSPNSNNITNHVKPSGNPRRRGCPCDPRERHIPVLLGLLQHALPQRGPRLECAQAEIHLPHLQPQRRRQLHLRLPQRHEQRCR